MTLAFGELMRWSYIRLEPLTGGSMGMAVPPADLFGWKLDTEWHKFYVFLAIAIVTVIATDRLLRSRVGRAFMAIKDNETAAAAMGIATSRYFVLGFAWSGFVVGLGGSMFAVLIGHLSPESFNLVELILEFAIIMVGGLGSLDRIDSGRRRHHRVAGGLCRMARLSGDDFRSTDRDCDPVHAAGSQRSTGTSAPDLPRSILR